MRISSKGQLTIPLAIRERLGINANSEADFVGERVVLVCSLDASARYSRLVQ